MEPEQWWLPLPPTTAGISTPAVPSASEQVYMSVQPVQPELSICHRPLPVGDAMPVTGVPPQKSGLNRFFWQKFTTLQNYLPANKPLQIDDLQKPD